MATPYTTSCGISLTSIDGTDCIGDSRGYINNNVQNLGNAICTLTTNLTALSSSVNFNIQDSNTIDLTWNTGTKILSADVRPDSIRYSQLASWQTLSASPTLSAEAVTQRVAKAWVVFNGATTSPQISASFNVSSIVKTSTSRFILYFTTPMSDTNYITLGSGVNQDYSSSPPNNVGGGYSGPVTNSVIYREDPFDNTNRLRTTSSFGFIFTENGSTSTYYGGPFRGMVAVFGN